MNIFLRKFRQISELFKGFQKKGIGINFQNSDLGNITARKIVGIKARPDRDPCLKRS